METLQAQGGAVRVDADRLRELAPEYGQGREGDDATAAAKQTQWAAQEAVQRVRSRAIKERRNMVEEGTFRDAKLAEQLTRGLHQHGYEVEVNVVAASLEESRLGTFQRYEDQHAAGAAKPRFVDEEYQRNAYAKLRDTVERIEDQADRITVVDRSGRALYDSDRDRDGSALKALDAARETRTSAQRVETARGWDEVAAMAAGRNAPAAWQSRIQAHHDEAHFAVQADPTAAKDYQAAAGAERAEASRDAATRHGSRLADALEKVPPKEAVKEHPELASAYGTLASARAFAKARLPEAKREAFMEGVTAKVTADLKAGRHPPKVDLTAGREQDQSGELER